MDVGVLLVFQNWHEDLSDAEMFRQETELGVLAEELGFDSVWAAEHHFDDYSMCPDNLQLMTYLAARTSRIKLGTGAVILPWNDPLRVVEKVTMLDILSGGRAIFGMGRGLAKMEYEGFRQDMNESRGRFDEAAPLILAGLRNGYVENDGPFYRQPRVDVRPAPEAGRDWSDRLYGVAMSPDSVPAVAKVGARMMTFMQYPAEQHVPAIERYRECYRSEHGTEPGPVLTQDFIYCHEDPEVAERTAREYLSRYFLSVVKHYDFAGKHWRETKGYEAYQVGADMIREAGMEAAASGYADTQIWGTPEQIVEKYRRRVELFGDHQPNVAPSFAGLPFDKVRASLRLFGEKVVPELQKMGVTTAVPA
ncbi:MULTISPECIES: LLM class flavin-dependent oxidoreductase [unclassified Pseudonocardia]|uniref:LLM class flavin-dependent oxidoreductase n=1 Tax=unclassified Pseudonocardia TaxID=2619320 RepID=UPI0001FFF013|nr:MULTISPECIES: LLM class flavin-dependent oxidoreductase [unclassified Pseudonocardia]ALE73072.1 alkane 1-monooxygenase [Pseudonocardia sp. EC080625-04]OLM19325.1 Alkanal monooxygenase (FMN-linked) [Pseudonocardia sp. Ae707_Ps1]